MTSGVLVEDVGAVRTITLDRPQARNAIDLAVARAVAAAVQELEARDDLRVGILTGSGGHFCAGMDLKAFAAGENPVLEVGGLAGLVSLPRTKVLIAAVEGWALAGGLELALACDLMVVATSAQFGLPEVKRGLVASSGGLLRLPRRIPAAVALEYALTGDPFGAEDAHRHGLTNTVVPDGTALSAAFDLAARIVANAPLAVAATRRIVDELQTGPVPAAFSQQAAIADPVIASEDALEGARAFAEKRPPVWVGN
ncbi:crotonase/enoyl-CoA hydratase family protein [Nocardioides sp. SR21]|uniref:crotonase/enoyl-CoA hydratase family protein n=1 Tax=Nocardioides sp. SR21 TaxID=2919501 RepID=UPI001FA9E9DB|nr:crotonase/enoyl-CoA hydratase family protein [Nocardioides sp. SR21]